MGLNEILETCADIEETKRLMTPLAEHLQPLKFHNDINAIESTYINLNVDDWKDQYEAGINRCMGFDILWDK